MTPDAKEMDRRNKQVWFAWRAATIQFERSHPDGVVGTYKGGIYRHPGSDKITAEAAVEWRRENGVKSA